MYTITAKVKTSAKLVAWYRDNARKAALLYNECLDAQFSRAANGEEKLFSKFDLVNRFRGFELGSDYKDQVIERAAKATANWYSTETVRYELYWKMLAKHRERSQVEEGFQACDSPHLVSISQNLARQADYRSLVKSLSGDRRSSVCPGVAERVLVGVDLGLKTTRTAVAVHEASGEIKEVYQPTRERFFDGGYRALVEGSQHERRALAFVHRKIARRRKDSIGKDVEKILSMGDVFKFGKPGMAFLLSGRLARSASDAANSEFLTRFVKRAQQAGKEAGEVDERNTTVSCPKCGTKKKMWLSDRVFECGHPGCGHIEDRDQNSAYQIAFRSFLPHDDKAGQKGKRRATAPGDEIPTGKDSQAPPPCKPPTSVGGGVVLV